MIELKSSGLSIVYFQTMYELKKIKAKLILCDILYAKLYVHMCTYNNSHLLCEFGKKYYFQNQVY